MAAPAKTTRTRSRAKKAAVERRIVVALDGPASSGKSSVGAAAAGRLGLRFVDTGLLYRALTAAALREGSRPTTRRASWPRRPGHARRRRHRAPHDRPARRRGHHRQARGPDVDAAVSSVSKLAEVRQALLPRQRARGGWRDRRRGRDIGTVVLPDADSSCSSTRRSRSGPRDGSTSAAWTRRRRGRAVRAQPAIATTRTATGRSHRSGPRTTP